MYTMFTMLERVQEGDAGLVVLEKGLLFITAGGDVIHPVRDRIAVKKIDQTLCAHIDVGERRLSVISNGVTCDGSSMLRGRPRKDERRKLVEWCRAGLRSNIQDAKNAIIPAWREKRKVFPLNSRWSCMQRSTIGRGKIMRKPACAAMPAGILSPAFSSCLLAV
jgi:hypothetical protein